MTLPLWNAVESVANAIDELRKKTCDLAEKVAKDVVQLEQKVEALTVEVEQLKRGQFGSEPDPSSFTGKRAGLAPSYDWWVVDSSGKWPAEGTTDSLVDAASFGLRAMAKVSPTLHPCVLRVCERRLVVEVSSGGIDRASKVESDPGKEDSAPSKSAPLTPETIPVSGWGAIKDGRITGVYSDRDGRPDRLIWIPTAGGRAGW